MKSTTLKSIGAVLAGFFAAFIVTVLTDVFLEKTGFMIREPFNANPTWLISLIVVYRTIYNVAGFYLAARLAPNRPMRHAMIIGIIGFVFSTIGTIVMWHIPPHWYPIAL